MLLDHRLHRPCVFVCACEGLTEEKKSSLGHLQSDQCYGRVIIYWKSCDGNFHPDMHTEVILHLKKPPNLALTLFQHPPSLLLTPAFHILGPPYRLTFLFRCIHFPPSVLPASIALPSQPGDPNKASCIFLHRIVRLWSKRGRLFAGRLFVTQ